MYAGADETAVGIGFVWLASVPRFATILVAIVSAVVLLLGVLLLVVVDPLRYSGSNRHCLVASGSALQ